MTKVSSVPVKSSLAAKSHLKGMKAYEEKYQQSIQEPEKFWLDAAKNLEWFKFPETATKGDFNLSLIHI